MDQSRIIYLVGRHLEKGLTAAEQAEFGQLLRDPESHDALLAAFDALAGDLDISVPPDASLLPILHTALASDRPPMQVASRRRWYWPAAAAAAVLAIVAGGYLWLSRPAETRLAHSRAEKHNILPGKEGAILTLADGSEVVLDSLGNGTIARQNGAQLVLANAQLSYQPAGTSAETVTYNTITTPRGRQFRVVLSDGTEVWLNAASSLRYPTVFGEGERQVEVKGEAYFEVAADTKRPFHVNVNKKADILVLGTHFNVNAYDNEKTIATTLMEGAVRVSATVSGKAAEVVLRPGQQARISAAADRITVKEHADVDNVIAWKNGLFNFEGADFADIMRQLERWYDIEVVYGKGIPDIEFEGQMTRDVPLNGLLTILSRSGIQFRLEGRKLIVQP
ncbi:FecR family protein [Chitinophaga terrae (ex Kim and Jung 2007)]|uniref:FecR family protein n=1 Tax=Chitinophaga terrae (ex Kim and Jung 2007) TaxID=408074 RepID=A0A1H4EKS6_9BACT|nr:FecR family protein [Chitinophaga terrae (ex Kim and Jung 2007)]GEP91699.1 iron dicitrate transporter FecR [Chitinophaga terrae (ex Kim and Jung 2007)]SEA85651.1 FecR family protein [Chitinophaga terrae (ex Kim and Jung 2007)]